MRTLPPIELSKFSSVTVKMLNHELAKTKPEDKDKPLSRSKTKTAPRDFVYRKQPHQQDFRTAMILEKNQKFISLLAKGGKTVAEINAILGVQPPG